MSDWLAMLLPCIQASVSMTEVFDGVDPPAAETVQAKA